MGQEIEAEIAQIKLGMEHDREVLHEIRDLVKDQNTRVRINEVAIADKASVTDVQANEVAIAKIQTWVAIVGGIGGAVGGLGVIISAVMWALK